MSDYTLPPCNTLVAGMIGSGKSTFCYKYLRHAPGVACRFLFDDLGRHVTRLGIAPASTAEQLEAALPDRWVIFRPHAMFPGDIKAAFEFFCDWILAACRRGPGKKIVHVDEVWQYQDGRTIPAALARLCQLGREENIELLSATQNPQWVNPHLTGTSTELVCFRLAEDKALAEIQRLGLSPPQIAGLPLGKFISINRLSGRTLAGKVF